ncbi:NmrA family NAD(P)-binding protein [Kineococcus sp. SYSU DK003]|uniref:NmrA family NAD(P)-binding protein n=1 Tax=Kineococcus sp. SYSU DK003 TaxID=3383124 RepID=UPI003D7EB21B
MITVLGASGNTGRAVVRTLLAAGEEVRAVGRRADRLAQLAPGAVPFAGDAADRGFLADAFTGADAAYVLSPFDAFAAGYRQQQRAVGEAIAGALADARVRHVVALSSLGAEQDADTGFLSSLHDQELRLRALDADVLFLRPGLFFESFAVSLDAMRAEGVHADSIDPDVALPVVATADVAAVAAQALLARAGSGVREVLGPRDRTVPEVVAALGPRIGVPSLRYVRVPDEAMRAALVQAGLPADVADLQVRMNAALNAGVVRSTQGRSAATSSPTEFEEWADALPAPSVPA